MTTSNKSVIFLKVTKLIAPDACFSTSKAQTHFCRSLQYKVYESPPCDSDAVALVRIQTLSYWVSLSHTSYMLLNFCLIMNHSLHNRCR